MSNSENISLWKKKSEIDYIPLFISLWLCLNAWLKDRFPTIKKDRKLIDLLKTSDGTLKDRFDSLINGDDSESNTFKGYFAELHRSLENANLEYSEKVINLIRNSDGTINKKISFHNSIIDWGNGNSPALNSVIKKKGEHDKIEIAPDIFIDKDINFIFPAYIENLYQVRCLLFHGNLAPESENERVIKAFYLTLSMIMEHV